LNTLPVIVNPAARGGRAAPPREELARAASARGWELEWWETRSAGHAAELAARAARDRYPQVAAWGGDGTYNEAARGLAGSDCALLVLPGGTTSVLAYELGVSRRPAHALAQMLAGERREMALARTDRGQLFLLMLSAGPDSVILTNLTPERKARGGKLGITRQAFVELARGDLPRFEVGLGDRRLDVSWCIVGNSRCYGGPYHATPGADPFVPGFETVLLRRHGRAAVVPFFFAIRFGLHLRLPGVERLAATEVVLSGSERIPYQLDGDPAGFLPVTARATGERMWVVVPR
jgi:diacylglycerol kinase (ATP)